MKRSNIVFIMTDHQRSDSIGMEQCNIEVTPNLNKLARESVVFTRAYNTCPLCVPCRTALATGKYPTHNGVVFNDWNGTTSKDNKTIHQILAENGYRVSHVGVNHIKVKPPLKERIEFGKWIDQNDYNVYLKGYGIVSKRDEKQVTEVKEQRQNGEFITKKYSNTYVSEWNHDIEKYKDNYFTREALEVIENKGFIKSQEEPFALFINYWAPHPPLKVPKEYINLFDPDKIDLPENVGKTGNNEPKSRRQGVPAQLAKNVTEKEWRKVWSAHLGLLHYVDNQIGQIINAIEEKGLMDNTIIIFTSDHGDHLGQHSMYQKMEMYEQAIHVPLIIKIPEVNASKIDNVMSHLDILPTIMDQLCIEENLDLDGISQKESIHNGGGNKERKVFCQYSGNPELGCTRRAVITKKYKYVYDQMKEEELYDLEVDPLEMNNIVNDKNYKEIVSKLHGECVNWAKEKNDWIF